MYAPFHPIKKLIMNNYKLPVIAFSLLLLITSCKKNDALNQAVAPAPSAASTAVKTSEWKSISNWTSTVGEKFTVYTTKIEDSTLTQAVANSGLVLVFTKNGNVIKALPFQEKENSDTYWYYQVSKGVIILSCDNYSGSKSFNTAGFKYFVFSAEQLKNLETKGHSKIELMQLSYDNVATLLN